MGTLSLKRAKAPNGFPEHPISKEVILKLVRSFLPRVDTPRGLGLFARDLLVLSHSDERLHDPWNARPSCVLTHLPLLLFSLRLVKFPRFSILRETKSVL